VKSVATQSSAQASVTPPTVSYQPEGAKPVAVSKPEPAKPTAKSRLWTKADESAIVRATFLSLSGNVVKLRQSDGMDIRISLDQLSQADRDWIEENQQQH
jgi:hypothetical protein